MAATSFATLIPPGTTIPATFVVKQGSCTSSRTPLICAGLSSASDRAVTIRKASLTGYSKCGIRGFRTSSIAASALEEDVDVSGSEIQTPGSQGNKLYVGNLPFNVDSESLAGIFGQAGEVDQVDVIYDRETGRSRGFAFVTMVSPSEADAAIERFDGSELGGRMLRVNYPVAKGERPPRVERDQRAPRPQRTPLGSSPASGTKLYVGNLSWGMDDYGLADLFSEFGQVMEAKVVLDRDTGKSRGFGFVTFSSPNEGEEAVNALDGVEVDGRTVRVSVAQERPSGGSNRF